MIGPFPERAPAKVSRKDLGTTRVIGERFPERISGKAPGKATNQYELTNKSVDNKFVNNNIKTVEQNSRKCNQLTEDNINKHF